MAFRSYPYQGQIDTERMRELLASMRAGGGHSCWHVGDLVWRLFLQSLWHDLGQTFRLWDDASGQLAGFAVWMPSRYRAGFISFELQVCPRLRSCGLEEEMLSWVEAQCPQKPAACHLVTDVGVYEDDQGQIAALERRGFRRMDDEGVLFIYPLDEPVAEPSLPDGLVARPVAGEQEAAARAAAHRDAFDSTRVTDEAYLRLMRTPGYDRDLDMVAAAPDGTIAAFCLGWLDPANRVGEFEPVGTRQAFRRQGLGQAVALAGLRRMQARGAESVVVGPVDAAEEAAMRMYQSAGFRPIYRTYGYAREI
ncbi:MAG: GNAT family N-acetyltransferase [Anaerolineae bacterium]|nr:GNAT family N-acetyltransferase [Anaerolineae bacterium]